MLLFGYKNKNPYRANFIVGALGVLIVLLFFVGALIKPLPVLAATGINEQINYQARLLGSTGAVVADGTYNLEFKIYQDGTGCVSGGSPPCSGTLKWTETRTGSNKVTVKNGYFSVQLGSVTAFGTSVDWNQDTLWLSINVGGTGSPTWDGEMTPFRRLAAVPYAMNAKQLGGLDWSKFVQIAPSAVQTDTSLTSMLFLNKTGATGNILQLQDNGSDVLTIDNSGAVVFQNSTDSTTGFQIKDADGGTPIFNVDTTNERVGIGTASPSNTLTVNGNSNFTGKIALGTNAVIDQSIIPEYSGDTFNTLLNIQYEFTDLSADYNGGITNHTVLNPTVDASSVSFTNFNEVQIKSGNNKNFGTIAGNSGVVDHSGTGTVSLLAGNITQVQNSSSGALTTSYGNYVVVNNVSNGSITNAAGESVAVFNSSTGTITNAFGLNIGLFNQNAGGNITNAYGIRIDSTNAGTIGTYYGLYLADGPTIGTTTYGIYSKDRQLTQVDSLTASEVQDNSGNSIAKVNTTDAEVTFNESKMGQIDSWGTASNALPAVRQNHAVASYNGYLYAVGGSNGSTLQTTVYYAKVLADGSPDTWNTTTALSTATQYHRVVASNGYMYLLGGNTGSTVSTVSYAKINTDGTLGSWSTTTSLPAVRQSFVADVYNGYIYVVGGFDGSTAQTTVYYARPQANGTISAWSTAGNALPTATRSQAGGIVNGYLYNAGGVGVDEMSRSKLADNGAPGTWTTQSAYFFLITTDMDAFVGNGKLYTTGGNFFGCSTGVNYSTPDSAGAMTATGTDALPAGRCNPKTTVENGYAYVIGGENSGAQSTVYYGSLPRTAINGSLDLVSLSGLNTTDTGGLSTLYAGDISAVGNLSVQGEGLFGGGLVVNSTFRTVGDSLFEGSFTQQNLTDSVTAFQIKDADGGTSVLNVDTVNERVGIGDDSPDYTLDVNGSSTSGTAGDESLAFFTFIDTGAVSSGTDNTIGQKIDVTRTGASGSTVLYTYGLQSLVTGDTGGTSNAAGLVGLSNGADTNTGVQGFAAIIGTQNVTTLVGVEGLVGTYFATGVSSATNAYGVQAGVGINTGTTTFTNAAGINVASAFTTSGAITDNYGIRVNTQTAGANNYGVRIDTATTQTLWIAGDDASATTSAKGIAFGSTRDVTLFRGGANILQTDDDLYFTKESARTIKLADSTTAATAGAALSILGANGSSTTSGTGGAISITAGAGQAGNSGGGAINITGGAGVGISNGGAISITGGAALTGGNITINAGNGVADGNVRLVNADGRLAIGHTNSPGALVDIRARDSADALSVDNVALATNIAIFKDNGTAVLTIADAGTTTFRNSTDSTTGLQILDADGGTPIFNVDTTNERVGIGTAAPAATLDVVGSSATGPTLGVTSSLTGTSGYFGVGTSNSATVSPGSASSIGFYFGLFNSIDSGSSDIDGSILSSIAAQAIYNGSDTIVGLEGLRTYVDNQGVGTVDVSMGLYVTSTGNSGTITDSYGILVDAQTAGTNSYGIAIDTAGTQTLWLKGNGGTGGTGIGFGSSNDTNLYRADANVLKTDDSLHVLNRAQIGPDASVGTIAQCNALLGFADCTNGLEVAISSTETTNFTWGFNMLTGITPSAATNTSTNKGVNSVLALIGSQSFSGTNIAVDGHAIANNSAGTTTMLNGITGFASQLGSGSTVTTATGVRAGVAQSAGTLTTGIGLDVLAATGAITGSNYGIIVRNQTVGATDYGIYIEDAANYSLVLASNDGDAASGISFGSVASTPDTNLYRSAANTLKTEDAFIIAYTSASALSINSTASAETVLTADTAARSGSGGNLIKIGNSTGTDTATTILQLDSATADPTTNLSALNGGLFYNSTTNKVSIIENGVVKVVCNTTDAGCGAGGSGARLDQITAATGNATINSNANNIAWNWILAGAESGIAFGENTASTGGGAQDQFIVDISTLSGSTASPLRVTSNSVDAADIVFNLNSSGDMEIQDAGTAFATFSDAGAITFAPTGSSDINFTLDNDSNLVLTGTVTDSGYLQQIGLTLGDDAGADTVNGLQIDVTSATTGDADVLNGIRISNLASGSAVTERAISIGTGWDEGLYIESGGINVTAGNIITSNLGTQYTASDTNPSCSSGDYKIYADLSETKLKKCQNGTVTDLASGDKYEVFTSDGTWTKPSDAIMVIVQLWGAGGGGGGGAGGTNAAARTGGGAGGGGAFAQQNFLSSDLGSTVEVTIGTGGTAGTAGNNAVGGNGGAGNPSCFSTSASCAGTMILRAYGGGGGAGAGAAGNGGGGGGGLLSVGANSTSATGGAGGNPLGAAANALNSGAGGGGGRTATTTAAAGGASFMGGGGGGGSTTTGAANSGPGGGSVFGGSAGGGGGSCAITTCTARNGGAGGSSSSVSGGGGAAGTGGGAGGDGADGTGTGGAGGGGGANSSTGNGGDGGDGGAQGGGGGGGGGAHTGSTVGGAGGDGGRGEVRIYSIRGNGADLAEIYGSKEKLDPGDVVCIDPEMRAGVKRCNTPYSQDAIGVVTTSPGLIIGAVEDHGAVAAPIVLSGRTPVRVSNENGPIKIGDLLTSSSTPGVAMKATKASRIIGQAMAPHDGQEVGAIMAFIHTDNSAGSTKGLLTSDGEDFASIEQARYGKEMLNYLANEKASTAPTTNLSEIFTDRVVAGIEVITPRLTANEVVTDGLKPLKDTLGIELNDSQSVAVKTSLGEEVANIDSKGNATFKGTITADKIKANEIEGLELFTNKISSLEEKANQSQASSVEPGQTGTNTQSSINSGPITTQSALVLNDLNVNGALFANGALKVMGPAEFMEQVSFYKLASFIDRVVFRQNVSFENNANFGGNITVNKNIAGKVKVPAGQTKVKVEFTKPYAQPPIINITPNGLIDVKYGVVNTTTEGFEIQIDPPQTTEIEFNWFAVETQ